MRTAAVATVRSVDVPEQIRTDRLVLRRPVVADVPALHAYRSLPDVCRYLPFEPQSPETVAGRVAAAESDESAELPMFWRVVEVAGGAVVGDVIVFLRSREHRGGEIGWVLHPAHQGRGYATEASAGILDVTFDRLGLHRVVARLDARNEASARVCRRLGMRPEARLVENEWFKGEWTDEVLWAVLDREWRAARF